MLAGARIEIASLVTGGDPILTEHLLIDPPAAACAGQGLNIERPHSFAVVLLRLKEKVTGTLTPMSRVCHQFTPQDVGLLSSIGSQIRLAT
ncbi:MAG: hypothetical protein CEE40_01980 [Chloroflexi bacterium B3_Chlor]|nr:MAG: hypothetical protein CEE40_01980 [Chloroflexi bacterium B3_Chlor]